MNDFSATTVLMVRHRDRVTMASDGQVSFNNTIIKSNANKVKRAGDGKVLVGFAGGAADGLALFSRFEAKLSEYQGNLERAVVELAKDWRTDRVMRQLQAHMIVTDLQQSFLASGNGDLMQPDADGVLAIGSGANFALAAARALMRNTDKTATEIVREAMAIAAEICVFTNDQLTLEEL